MLHYVVYLPVSITTAFLANGKFPELTTSLLQAYGNNAFARFLVDTAASQADRANPFTTFTAASRFVSNAGLAAEGVTTMRADHCCDPFQNLEILGGRDAPHRFSRDNDAILKGLSAAGTRQ
jgi:hypothetical protein